MVGLLTYIWHQNQEQTKQDIADLRVEIVERDRREEKDKAELRDMLRTNGRHLDSLIHGVWNHNWRINGIEDFLADTTDFRPPRIIGESEIFPKAPGGD